MKFERIELQGGSLPCDECGKNTKVYYVLYGDFQAQDDSTDKNYAGVQMCYKCFHSIKSKLLKALNEPITLRN